MKMKNLLRACAFFLIFVLLFSFFTRIFERETISGPFDYTNKLNSFYNLQENCLDVIGFGSSHMYCTLNPAAMQEESGYSAYVLATQQQPIIASYYYMKEAFKTQSPKYVVFEAFMVGRNSMPEDAVLFDAITPLHFSLNKLQMIHSLTKLTDSDKAQFYFTLLKYHSRWNELTKEDFTYTGKGVSDPYNGAVHLESAVPQNVPTLPLESSAATLEASDTDILSDMNRLCKEHGATFIILYAPFPDIDEACYSRYLAVKEFCCSQGILFYDGLEGDNLLGYDFDTDFYDSSHFNASGSAKFTVRFSSWLNTLTE